MDFDALVTFAQEHFTDGLALVIGSGLSAAEGIMPGHYNARQKHRSRPLPARDRSETAWKL